MTDFKSIVDAEMNRIEEIGNDINHTEDPQIKSFFEALLSNSNFKNGICNTMHMVSQKFGGVMMSEPASAGELKEILTSIPMARPILNMTYIGFLMGKAQAESEKMEKMFGAMELDMKESN